MRDYIVENQLDYARGGKIKRYRRKHLRAQQVRENEERANAERAQKRLTQWLRGYDNPRPSNR